MRSRPCSSATRPRPARSSRKDSITKAEPELVYKYAQFLHEQRDWKRGREVVEAGLRSPTLAEGPIAEGELRVELAKNLSAQGDDVHAREQIQRASPLIPKDDEARADADSMLRVLGR